MGGSWGNGLASRWGEALAAGRPAGWGPRLWVSLVLCQGGLSHRAEAALPKQGLKMCGAIFHGIQAQFWLVGGGEDLGGSGWGGKGRGPKEA